VCAECIFRIGPGLADKRLSSVVEYHIGIGLRDGPLQSLTFGYVAGNYMDTSRILEIFGRAIEPSRPYLISAGNAALGSKASEETGASGNKDPHSTCLPLLSIVPPASRRYDR